MPKRLVCTNCLAPQPNPITGLCVACANAALPPRDRELKAKRAKREGMRQRIARLGLVEGQVKARATARLKEAV